MPYLSSNVHFRRRSDPASRQRALDQAVTAVARFIERILPLSIARIEIEIILHDVHDVRPRPRPIPDRIFSRERDSSRSADCFIIAASRRAQAISRSGYRESYRAVDDLVSRPVSRLGCRALCLHAKSTLVITVDWSARAPNGRRACRSNGSVRPSLRGRTWDSPGYPRLDTSGFLPA
jgi:hypothetical protein